MFERIWLTPLCGELRQFCACTMDFLKIYDNTNPDHIAFKDF